METETNDSSFSQDMFADSDEEEEVSFRGTEFSELKKHAKSCSNWRESRVFFQHQDWTKPFPSHSADIWDNHHVRLPWSNCNEFPIDGKIVKRWPLVEQALLNPEILQSDDLIEAILSYNRSDRWNFDGLKCFLDECIEDEEKSAFYTTILPKMCSLALELPLILTKPMPLLQRCSNDKITLSQKQIASLLANAFFCTFPKRNSKARRSEYASYPTINFNSIFARTNEEYQMEKLKCMINYFRKRIDGRCADSIVTFTRRALTEKHLPHWRKSVKLLRNLRIDSKGTIEDVQNMGMLEVDFANAYIGGGVLGHGCVQEEIRFLICPELIISRLFTERLQDNEVLVIEGFERYSNYTGYASTFKFDGDYIQKPLANNRSRAPSTLVAMDALHFHTASNQFRQEHIDRELNKVFIGFFNENEGSEPSCVASGNWGCGAFGGDPQLKSLLQLMGAAENGRDVLYFTFGDEKLRDDIFDVFTLLKNKNVSVGSLYNILTSYWKDVLQNVNEKEEALKRTPLFDYIRNCLLFEEETDIEEENLPAVTINKDETTEQESFPSQEKLSSTPAKQTKITDHFNNKPAPKVTDL